MGGICSKSSNQPDNFSSPGRPLGSAAPPPSSAPVPAKVQKPTTGGQKLGGSGSGTGEAGSEDPRSAAARAAEERASKANRPGGKLATKLSEQKKQTQNQLLNEGSEQNRRTRDADEGAEARNWN